MPIIFSLLGYLLIFVVTKPVWDPLALLAKSMMLDQTYDFGDVEYPVTYIPGEEIEVPDDGRIPGSSVSFPKYGTLFGEIIVESAKIKAPLLYGDSNKQLKKGVGIYPGSNYPGCSGTVLVAGHNNSHFRKLQYIEVGDLITVKTTYGTYVYEVTGTAIKGTKNMEHLQLGSTEENLILYTCHPFNTLGLTPYRYFVYAKYVSGPMIDLHR